MKVIFLDFNGVLDTYENMNVIDQNNLNRLKKIIDETDSKIVISSSLKNSYYITGHLSKKLLNIIKEIKNIGIDVIGITPYDKTREIEIQLYLDNHPEIEIFCIIDDDYFMESFKDNLIKLPIQSEENPNGLEDEHVELAINILNKQKTKSLK